MCSTVRVHDITYLRYHAIGGHTLEWYLLKINESVSVGFESNHTRLLGFNMLFSVQN